MSSRYRDVRQLQHIQMEIDAAIALDEKGPVDQLSGRIDPDIVRGKVARDTIGIFAPLGLGNLRTEPQYLHFCTCRVSHDWQSQSAAYLHRLLMQIEARVRPSGGTARPHHLAQQRCRFRVGN